jgi:hypothetical protein
MYVSAQIHSLAPFPQGEITSYPFQQEIRKPVWKCWRGNKSLSLSEIWVLSSSPYPVILLPELPQFKLVAHEMVKMLFLANKNSLSCVRIEVLPEVALKNIPFRDMMTCSILQVYGRFGKTNSLSLQCRRVSKQASRAEQSRAEQRLFLFVRLRH